MNNILNLFILVSFLCLEPAFSYSQVMVSNSSFEGQTADATMPSGWHAVDRGTTPDILPGYWGVYLEPEEGDSYVGLITRSDGSNESIGQRLPSPLKEKLCYSFTIDLAHSDNYSGYNQAITLKIWISDTKGKKQQLIYNSGMIEHLDWKTYQIEFTPQRDMHYLILEAFNPGLDMARKGNILLDNMSFISNCSRA